MNQSKVSNQEQEIKQLTLHEMRKESGVSGSSVARICGTTYHSLRNWEKGETIPNIVNIYDLLQIYGYSFYELDLKPYYALLQERISKKEKFDALTDDMLRDRRQYEEQQKQPEYVKESRS